MLAIVRPLHCRLNTVIFISSLCSNAQLGKQMLRLLSLFHSPSMIQKGQSNSHLLPKRNLPETQKTDQVIYTLHRALNCDLTQSGFKV